MSVQAGKPAGLVQVQVARARSSSGAGNPIKQALRDQARKNSIPSAKPPPADTNRMPSGTRSVRRPTGPLRPPDRDTRTPVDFQHVGLQNPGAPDFPAESRLDFCGAFSACLSPVTGRNSQLSTEKGFRNPAMFPAEDPNGSGSCPPKIFKTSANKGGGRVVLYVSPTTLMASL